MMSTKPIDCNGCSGTGETYDEHGVATCYYCKGTGTVAMTDNKAVDSSREAFEAWHLKEFGWTPTFHDGRYNTPTITDMCKAYIAALASRAATDTGMVMGEMINRHKTAITVLRNMLRHAGLQRGADVANEMLADIAALSQQPASSGGEL